MAIMDDVVDAFNALHVELDEDEPEHYAIQIANDDFSTDGLNRNTGSPEKTLGSFIDHLNDGFGPGLPHYQTMREAKDNQYEVQVVDRKNREVHGFQLTCWEHYRSTPLPLWPQERRDEREPDRLKHSIEPIELDDPDIEQFDEFWLDVLSDTYTQLLTDDEREQLDDLPDTIQVDRRGYSPMIADELADEGYMQDTIFIFDPEQQEMALGYEEYSFIDQLLDDIYQQDEYIAEFTDSLPIAASVDITQDHGHLTASASLDYPGTDMLQDPVRFRHALDQLTKDDVRDDETLSEFLDQSAALQDSPVPDPEIRLLLGSVTVDSFTFDYGDSTGITFSAPLPHVYHTGGDIPAIDAERVSEDTVSEVALDQLQPGQQFLDEEVYQWINEHDCRINVPEPTGYLADGRPVKKRGATTNLMLRDGTIITGSRRPDRYDSSFVSSSRGSDLRGKYHNIWAVEEDRYHAKLGGGTYIIEIDGREMDETRASGTTREEILDEGRSWDRDRLRMYRD